MTEQIHAWTAFHGQTLDGRYPLLEPIEINGKSALFQTTVAGRPRVVRIFAVTAEDRGGQLRHWHALSASRHPNILEVLAVGTCLVGENDCLYLVLEPWEDDLSAVLKERALTEEEASDVMESMGPALQHLHGLSLSPGAISPTDIVAVGDAIKLRCGSLCAVSGLSTDELKPLRTILGLTGKPSDANQKYHAPEATLAPKPGNPKVVAPRRILWMAAGAIALVSLFALWMIYKRRAPSAATAMQSPPAASATAGRERLASTPSAVSEAPAANANWRVIAYSFRLQKDAQTRAGRVNAKWPGMQASVFAPQPGRSPYLVALGKAATREQAERLRRMAVLKGLPRDTFIRNYKHE